MSKKKKSIEELLKEALVPEEEQPYEVPNNWIWIRLENATKFIDYRGKTPKKTEKGIRLITAKNVRMNRLNIEPQEFIAVEDYDKWMTRGIPKKGDILFTTEAPLGNVAQLDTDEKVALAQRIITLSPYSMINNNFLKLVLMSPQIQSLIGDNSTGTTVSGIKASKLKLIPISLPPLREQIRIAEKVERLLNKIDEAKRLIEEANETFELRRASILDMAFRGELTRKWRQLNTFIITANKWLEDINSLKVGSKTKFKDQLDPSILDMLYELPNEWEWVRLNDLMESSTYGTSAKTNDDVTGTPVLRMGNIVDGYLELNNLKYLPSNHEDVLKYDLQTNDLLFNRTNSYELVGKTAVITEEVSGSFTFASYLIKVRLFYKDILANYVSHYINSHLGRKILLSMVTQQVGQANINSQKLASLPIPLPPKEEVVEIAKWLNNYRELENKQKEMLLIEESFEALEQSILSKAFRGELRTNDPNEESAIELLKEVLQEQVK
ncbi:restriction endonuclease subunit S [Neobacillus jeddahensis]|uniref:restriction endonuclease subunit S n=1 Tax=Neobacillus jeddahensis TaxID=1461580 RepID=UPI0005915BC6|nr:restriction endonuclease subunit S [Neobacillus jeddahensis]